MSAEEKKLLKEIAALSGRQTKIHGDCAYNDPGAINRQKLRAIEKPRGEQNDSRVATTLDEHGAPAYKRTKSGSIVRVNLSDSKTAPIVRAPKAQKAALEERNLLRTIAALSGAINREKIQKQIAPPTTISIDPADAVKYRSTKRTLVRADLPRPKKKVKRKTRPKRKYINKLCHYFTKFGKCHRGESCPCIHDKQRTSICRKFLSGNCPLGEECLLSHSPTPERMPHCAHFQRGACTRPGCLYTHVKVSPDAVVCRDFAVHGYCGNGAQCKNRHVWECPDFAKDGKCPNRKCPMPHVVRRKRPQTNGTSKRMEEEAPTLEVETVPASESLDGDFVTKPDYISLFIASEDELESHSEGEEGEESDEEDEDEDDDDDKTMETETKTNTLQDADR